jgi:hypothetical protein
MEVLGPAPEALSKQDIIRRFDKSLTEIIKACQDQQFEFERQTLVNRARRAWQYVKGNHFNVPAAVDSQYGEIFDFVPYEGTGDEKLCPPVNMVGGDLYKFCAVMGQNAPRVKAVADDPEDVDSMEVAQNADVNIRDLWAKQKIDRAWKALAFHQYVTGPVFIRGIWNTDASKYGSSVEPQIEISMTPDGIPVPNVTGQTSYANGDAEVRIYSVLEVAIPWEAKTREDLDWLRCEVMRSKWKLLDQYESKDPNVASPLEQYRDQDVPDDDYSASTTAAQEARDAVTNPSGTGQGKKNNQWRFAEFWIKPYLFQAATNPEARRVLREQFPDGLYIARVGSITVEIDNRRVTDEWAICKIGRGEKIMENALCADAIPLNMAIDDLFGMAIETVLRAITQTIMDAQLIDREAMTNKEALPAEVIPTALGVDGDIRAKVFQIPPARLGDQVLPLMQLVRSTMQDITGIRPELSGGGAPTQTYREAKQRRDQALMQLSPQADEMRFAAEEIAEVLVKLRARYGSGTVKAQRRGAYGVETDMADMAQLKETGWHAEANDDFPMTLADRRDSVFSLLKDFSPEVQQALSIIDPLNIEEIFELIQVPGFESSIKDQKEKTLNQIQQLLQEQPLPGAPGPNGQPGPPQPSITPDQYDNHSVVATVAAAWMISKTGQQAKAQNPAGFANVEAYQAAHLQMSLPPQPPPPPPLKGNLALSAKLEDFPQLVNEVLQGAGLPPQEPPAPQIPAPGPADMAAPGPVNGPGGPPAPPQLESPIPPVPSGVPVQ